MTFRIGLLLILITGFVLSCSTGPEFERKSIYDENASVPNAKIIFPRTNSNRAVFEENAFRIKLNNAVINESSKIELISNKDGAFFEWSRLDSQELSDTLIVNNIQLSFGRHEISLFIDDLFIDKIYIDTVFPRKVNLLESFSFKGAIRLSWSKYIGDNFQKYIVLRNNEPIYITSELSDTTYTDASFPIDINGIFEMKYQIQVFDYDFEKFNISNQNKVLPDYIKVDVGKILTVYNSQKLFYSDATRVSNTINRYDFVTNQIETIKFDGADSDIVLMFINHNASPKKLIAAMANYNVAEINLDNFTVSRIIKVNKKIYELKNDPINKIYFARTGWYGRAVSYDYNFNLLHNYSERFDDLNFDGFELDFEKRLIFIENSDSENNRAIANYNSSGEIVSLDKYGSTKSHTNNTVLSKSKKYILRENSVYSISDLQNKLFSLRDHSTGFSKTFYFRETDKETLFVGTSDGYVIEYGLPSGELIQKNKKFNDQIIGFFEFESQLYSLIRNRDLYTRVGLVK